MNVTRELADALRKTPCYWSHEVTDRLCEDENCDRCRALAAYDAYDTQQSQSGEREAVPVAWTIDVNPVVVDQVPEACTVRLNIGVQHFHIGPDYWETREEGEAMAQWLAAALRKAMPVDIATMVNRFLGWPLPKNFSPDCHISFERPSNPLDWPVGTNLFTADQAKAMIEYMLAATPSPPRPDAQP